MSNNTFVLASAVTGLGLVGVLSLPAVFGLAAQLRKREPRTEVYEDEDGKSTPEAVKAYTAKIPKAFILLFASVGLGLSIALAVRSTLRETNGIFIENWLSVGTSVRDWFIVLFWSFSVSFLRNLQTLT